MSDTRQAQRIHGAVRFLSPTGGYTGEAEIWTLTPEYVREVAADEATTPRLHYGTRTPQRFYYPARREPPANLPPEIAEYLHRGTGLYPVHLAGLDLLQGEDDPEAYSKMLQSWRTLARCAPGLEIRPAWSGSTKCGRISASRPALQSLPGVMRREALEGRNRRELAEVDFRACHYQLRRIRAGWEPLADPWNHLAEHLRAEGFTVSPEAVKKIAHPVFNGMGKKRFRAEYADLVFEPDRLHDTLRAVFPRGKRMDGNEAMHRESQIMREVLTMMNRAGLPAGLPNGDAILTAYPEEVRAMMEQASRSITGYALAARPKQA